MDGQISMLLNKRWDIYMNKKEAIIKGGCSFKLSSSDRKKFIWEVVDNNAVEDGKYHDEIGLRGVIF